MRDPKSENIEGLKQHSFSWGVEIEVGKLALALAVIYVAYRVGKILDQRKADAEQGDAFDAPTIQVGGEKTRRQS